MEAAGGGSTISQQLAKNLFPRQHYSVLTLPVSKIKEITVATRLEDMYEKDEILMLYLNTVPFGGNVYGIEAASKRFFNKSAKELKTEEAATLIGMLKATTYYSPRLYPDRSQQRRNVVLSQMAKYNYLTEAQRDSLQDQPLVLDYYNVTHNTGLAPYFRKSSGARYSSGSTLILTKTALLTTSTPMASRSTPPWTPACRSTPSRRWPST